MILRGIAARALLSLTIFALSAAVVGGTVAAVGFSRLTSVSEGSAGALVLLGLVGLSAQSSESIRRREHDLALARLRGRRGIRLLGFAIAEPASVVIAGAVAGIGLGELVGTLAAGAWLPAGDTFRITGHEWVAAAVVTGGCLLVVAATTWQLMRSPLLEQLSAARRPKRAGVAGLLLRLVLVLGAVVAVYQAHQSADSRVDWVSLVSPAVVGLAAAQVLLWLMTAIFAVVVRRTHGARFGWFLTTRRLLRRADSLALIRIVVAAAVVFGVATSASAAAEGWRVERAKLQVGGPVSYPVPGGALRAYAAAHRADPEGNWLLPVAAYTTDTADGGRRVFVDTSRWRRVLGDFYAGTSSAALTGVLDRFPPAPPNVYHAGDRATLTVPTDQVPDGRAFSVTFQYVSDSGDVNTLDVRVHAGDGTSNGNGLTTFSSAVHDCRLACSLVELDVNGYAIPRLHLVGATFAGGDALAPASGFQPEDLVTQFLQVFRAPKRGLFLDVGRVHSYFGSIVGTYVNSAVHPAVTTPGASLVRSTGSIAVLGIDGSDRPIHVVAHESALPFVGTSGSLLDLGATLAGSSGSVPMTQAVVVARAGTPADVIATLRSLGGIGPALTFPQELRRLDETPRAQGTRLYLVIAGFAALIALLSLASAVTQQRRERRQEAASLRAAGVPAQAITGAYRTEVAVLASATLVGSALASWITCRALLASLPLVSGWAFAPPLDASPRLVWVTASAVAAALAVAVLGYLALHRIGRTSAPRMLREDL